MVRVTVFDNDSDPTIVDNHYVQIVLDVMRSACALSSILLDPDPAHIQALLQVEAIRQVIGQAWEVQQISEMFSPNS